MIGQLTCFDANGVIVAGVPFELTMIQHPDNVAGLSTDNSPVTISSVGVSPNNVTFPNLIAGAQYRIRRNNGPSTDFECPSNDSGYFSVPYVGGPL